MTDKECSGQNDLKYSWHTFTYFLGSWILWWVHLRQLRQCAVHPFQKQWRIGRKFKKRWKIGQNHLKYSSHTFTLSLPTLLDHHIMMEPLTTSTCNAPIKYGNVTVTHISIKCLGSPPDFRAIHETFPIIVGEIWTRGRFNRLPPSVHVTLSRKSLVLIVCAR